jgi:apolipoprotein N-acyltransferase
VCLIGIGNDGIGDQFIFYNMTSYMMDQIISLLTSNPLYLSVAAVISVVILLVLLKKLVKLALVVVAVFVLYVAFLSWSGQDVAGSVRMIEEFFSGIVLNAREYLKNLGS